MKGSFQQFNKSIFNLISYDLEEIIRKLQELQFDLITKRSKVGIDINMHTDMVAVRVSMDADEIQLNYRAYGSAVMLTDPKGKYAMPTDDNEANLAKIIDGVKQRNYECDRMAQRPNRSIKEAYDSYREPPFTRFVNYCRAKLFH
ncbi:hypothetical protein Barb6_00160 [Bacteroidales bacterium Barb6]|nr:hypothetical protein Barb6_00160 [Bacteroidales bacterium Barb6]